MVEKTGVIARKLHQFRPEVIRKGSCALIRPDPSGIVAASGQDACRRSLQGREVKVLLCYCAISYLKNAAGL
jgi:hypothetical protein